MFFIITVYYNLIMITFHYLISFTINATNIFKYIFLFIIKIFNPSGADTARAGPINPVCIIHRRGCCMPNEPPPLCSVSLGCVHDFSDCQEPARPALTAFQTS